MTPGSDLQATVGANPNKPGPRNPEKYFDGPLRVHPENPRYFTNQSGKVIYLTGSHTYETFQENPAHDTPAFDYEKFLLFLEERNHNFVRLWVWESPGGSNPGGTSERFGPMPYLQTGPGFTLDGSPKYDLMQWNPEYFDRLRQRVEAARNRGIYVGVQLFQGYSVAGKPDSTAGNPWHAHPYNKANNINGIDGDTNADNCGYEVHTLELPAITELQKGYVKKVIETVGDFENVLFEIANESHGASLEWQNHITLYIKEVEKSRKMQHPVWISYAFNETEGSGSNRQLFESAADAISPGSEADLLYDPALAKGEKVILIDSDPQRQVEHNDIWVWKSFARGHNPLFRDCYQSRTENGAVIVAPQFKTVRKAMGDTRRFSERMDMAQMLPVDDSITSSTRYCLAKPGSEYLVFQPDSAPFTIRPEAATYTMEWYHPLTGETKRKGTIKLSSGRYLVTPPWKGAAVLYLKKRGGTKKSRSS